MKVELPEHVMSYLEMFLNRVPLEGKEVPMFVQVVNALKSPITDVEPDK